MEDSPYAGNPLISEKNYPNGKRVLYITASPFGDWSASKSAGNKFVENYKKSV